MLSDGEVEKCRESSGLVHYERHTQGRESYCKCEMPYNPDDLMVQCENCKDKFHPSCMSFTPDQVKKMEQFVCPDCSMLDGEKKLRRFSPGSTPPLNYSKKLEAKRRKR